jgi:hypothetical protein
LVQKGDDRSTATREQFLTQLRPEEQDSIPGQVQGFSPIPLHQGSIPSPQFSEATQKGECGSTASDPDFLREFPPDDQDSIPSPVSSQFPGDQGPIPSPQFSESTKK